MHYLNPATCICNIKNSEVQKMKQKILTMITIGSIFCMALTGCVKFSYRNPAKADTATTEEAERPDDSEAEGESKEEAEEIRNNQEEFDVIERECEEDYETESEEESGTKTESEINGFDSTETFLLPDDAVEYNGHYYYLYSDICDTWEEAKTYCESVGGYLAIIDDDAENTFLYDLMKQAGHKNAYFGLSDCETEGVWKYVDGSDPEYTNWSNGEPNNERGVEHYAMFYYKSPEYQWNDGDFNHGTTNDNANFFCEWGPVVREDRSPQESTTSDDALEEDTVQSDYFDSTPFQQRYWVIFTEGYRNNRVEASTFDSTLPADQLSIIWNSALMINDSSGSDGCDQYYLDDNGEWVYTGNYHRLSDKAANVLASNLNIVDRNGNVIISASPYSMIDWDEIDSFQ